MMSSPRFSTASYAALAVSMVAVSLMPSLTARAQNDAPQTAKAYDLKAEALLQKAADRLTAAQSFSGQVTTIIQVPATETLPAHEVRNARVFQLQKPNLIYQESGALTKTESGAWNAKLLTPALKNVSDGTMGVLISLVRKTYRPTGVRPDDISEWYLLNFPGFFNPKESDAQKARDGKANGRLVSLTMAAPETFGGVTCSVIEEVILLGRTEKGTLAYAKTKIYVGNQDSLVHGYHKQIPSRSGDGNVQVSDDVLTEIVLDRKIPASVFTFDTTGLTEFIEPKQP